MNSSSLDPLLRLSAASIFARVMRFFVPGLLTLCAATAFASATPSTVTIDFEDATGFLVLSNYQYDGFRFSPNCHRDHPSTGPTGVFLGWDSSGCALGPPGSRPSFNLDWLGPPSLAPTSDIRLAPAYMFVDRAGAAFSLLSVDVVYTAEMTFLSSRGASTTSPATPTGGTVAFNGPAWTDLEWVLIGPVTVGFPVGVDNVVFAIQSIPEPASLGLVGVSLLLALGVRRKITRVIRRSPSTGVAAG